MAPNNETPTEPPIDRNNVVPDVATPRSRYSTAFCTAQREDLHDHAEAEPQHQHISARNPSAGANVERGEQT